MRELTIFEKIIQNKIPSKKIYEDQNFIAILDVNPNMPGHTLLITKEVKTNIFENSETVRKSILDIANKKIISLLNSKLEAKSFKLIFNIGKEAGQVIFHTHLHIIPYYNEITNNQLNALSIDEIYKKIKA